MNNEEEMEISIQDIIGILLSRIKFIILLTVLGTVAGFSVAKFVLPLKYTSSIKLYVSAADTTATQGNITYQEQQSSRNLAQTYIVFLQDNSVYEYVSDRLLEDYDIEDLKRYFTVAQSADEDKDYIPPAQLKSLVSVTAVDNTEVLQVTCTSEVPKFSADICSYIYEYAPKLIIRMVGAGSVEWVSPPKVPTAPSGPDIKKYTAIGFLLGFVLAAGIVFVMSLLDNTVTGGEDIKTRFNVPVLAEIPDIFMDEKGGSGKYGR